MSNATIATGNAGRRERGGDTLPRTLPEGTALPTPGPQTSGLQTVRE